MDTERKAKTLYQNYLKLINNQDESYVKKAVDLIKLILLEGKKQNFYVSFNGGKDATIVLFLTYFALEELQISAQIKCLYFEEVDPFIEMDEFKESICEMLNISIFNLESKKYQKQLTNFNQVNPIEWIVMGSRRDDPGCAKLKEISESDVHKGYPAFKRICPIIDWDYSTVWKFIKDYKIPYCKLYDEGYTSVGNKKNTKKNHHLYDKETKTYMQAENANNEVERMNREK